MIKNILLLSLFILALSCVSHEKKMLKLYGEQPDWVKKAPVSNSYYYGIGIINKRNNDYKQAAVKSALDNLANEISVEISSSSVLSTLETETSFQQEYSQSVQLYSKEQLEGYEMVDSWEDENNFYTCYRLSKSLYKQQKEIKIQNAKDFAKRNYLAAITAQSVGNYKQSVLSNLQALEQLAPFFDQNLSAEINGNEVNLAVEIINKIRTIESSLVLTPSFLEKRLKIGDYITSNDLFVTVTTQNGTKIANVPILFEYNSLTSTKEKTFTDGNGKASFNIGKIKSEKPHQDIFISMDFNRLIDENTKNRVVKKAINYGASNRVLLNLLVSPPKVFVKGKETLDENNFTSASNVKSSINNSLIEQNFDISNNEADADLILEFELASNSIIGVSRLLIVSTNCSITIRDKSKVIFSRTIPAQKGTHISKEEAINEAYKKVVPDIGYRILPQFKSQYYNY